MMEAGFQFEPKKTKLVKTNGIHVANLELLGLSLEVGTNLSSKTRGRGESPKRRSTLPQSARLESISKNGNLNFDWLKTNYKFLGFIQSKL
jgi:hypothetical protein